MTLLQLRALTLIQSSNCCFVTKSRQALCKPMDCRPPGSCVHGISQARKPEWVAISCFGDLPDPGMKPTSPICQANSLPPSHQGNPIVRYPVYIQICYIALPKISFITYFKNRAVGDFPSGPVVKFLHFQCRGHGFNPWLRN